MSQTANTAQLFLDEGLAHFNRGSVTLPAHNPPMNVASRTPSDTALDPITSCSSWYQTTS